MFAFPCKHRNSIPFHIRMSIVIVPMVAAMTLVLLIYFFVKLLLSLAVFLISLFEFLMMFFTMMV